MSGEHSIKETKELLSALMAISFLMIDRFSDGIGFDDALAVGMKIVSDKVLKEKISKAIDGIAKVGDEMKDIQGEEMSELVAYLLPEIISLIAKVKK